MSNALLSKNINNPSGEGHLPDHVKPTSWLACGIDVFNHFEFPRCYHPIRCIYFHTLTGADVGATTTTQTSQGSAPMTREAHVRRSVGLYDGGIGVNPFE